jgi:hypothetical protein
MSHVVTRFGLVLETYELSELLDSGFRHQASFIQPMPSLRDGVCAAAGRMLPTPSAAGVPNIRIDQIPLVAFLRILRGMPFTPTIHLPDNPGPERAEVKLFQL